MLVKTEKGRLELRPGHRSLGQRERALLLLADGSQTEAQMAELFSGDGRRLLEGLIARGYLDLMAEFGVTCSHSRPRVSNDNPTSESQFKTLKYQPDYPGRFRNAEHARLWCDDYFTWYNFKHHHSRLGYHTPAQVFTGQHLEIATARQAALDAQYCKHPERFVRGAPRAAAPPSVVIINPVPDNSGTSDDAPMVNFSTLPAAREALKRYP